MQGHNSFGPLFQFQFPGHRLGKSLGRRVESKLGQAVTRPLTGISFGYVEASRWLADAETVIAKNSACNLPIVARFRDFVYNTAGPDQLGARLAMTPVDMQGLDDFSLCSQSNQTNAQAAQAAAAQETSVNKLNYAALAGAGIAFLGLGYFIYKAS